MCHIMHYSRDAFLSMSLSEIVNLIEQHKRANEEQYKHANKNQTQTTQGETEYYGVDPATLERWRLEDEANGG